MSAIEVRVAGNDHSRFQSQIVVVDFHDLCRKLMAGNSGIADIGRLSFIRRQIRTADPTVEQLQQRFPFAADRQFLFFDRNLSNFFDTYAFHWISSRRINADH